MRSEFMEQLNAMMPEIHRKLSGGKEHFPVVYEPNVRRRNFREQLAEEPVSGDQTEDDPDGPHRDDLNFIVNGIDIRRLVPRDSSVRQLFL